MLTYFFPKFVIDLHFFMNILISLFKINLPIFKLIYYVDDIFYFRLFYTVYLMQLIVNKISDDWIRTADIWFQKRSL